MKTTASFSGFVSLCLLLACGRQTPAPAPVTLNLIDQINAPGAAYDSTLAARLGADEYGMKQYVMAFLKAGPNRDQDSLTAARLQKAHLDNIIRMAREGKLIVAGPFMDNFDIRGIYIFNVTDMEEARALTASDPAVQAGRLIMELHPWYGSASMQLINGLHKRVEKNSVAD